MAQHVGRGLAHDGAEHVAGGGVDVGVGRRLGDGARGAQQVDGVGELDAERCRPEAHGQVARALARLVDARPGRAHVLDRRGRVDRQHPLGELELEGDDLQVVALEVVDVGGHAQALLRRGEAALGGRARSSATSTSHHHSEKTIMGASSTE